MICRISTPVGGATPLSRHRHFRHGLNELSVSRSLSVQVYFIEIYIYIFQCIFQNLRVIVSA